MTVVSTPRRLKKYAIEAPITPPPQISTRIDRPSVLLDWKTMLVPPGSFRIAARQ
jgi:hypothetical protein